MGLFTAWTAAVYLATRDDMVFMPVFRASAMEIEGD